ncbi:mucin-2 isoform X2 [Uranotaenia lowii]|nr:mucin-2 isoform X2 [Uranotaenia lowii]
MAPKSTNAETSTAAAAGTSQRATTVTTPTQNISPVSTTDGLRHRHHPAATSAAAAAVPFLGNPGVPPGASTIPFPAGGIPPASADFIMSQQLVFQSWMQQAYMQYLNQYMNVISNGQNPQTVFPNGAPTNVNMPTASGPQPPTASTVPASANPMTIPSLPPNLAYYPYMSTMNSSPNLPTASSIPAPITTAASSASAALPSQPSTLPGPSTAGADSSISAAAPGPSTGTIGPRAPQTPNGAATNAVDHPAAEVAGANDAAVAAAGPAAAAAPARRFPNIVVEEQENRDWLDIFFSLCRVAILMTVVYLYSSPTRCITVLFIGISLYLYQMGFFRNNNADRLERARRIVVQQINNAHGVRPNVAPRPRARDEAAAPDAAENEPSAGASTANSSDTTDSTKPESNESADQNGATKEPSESEQSASSNGAGQNEENLPDQPLLNSSLPEANRINLNDAAAFLRTLVLSFFTSIIPDTPAA